MIAYSIICFPKNGQDFRVGFFRTMDLAEKKRQELESLERDKLNCEGCPYSQGLHTSPIENNCPCHDPYWYDNPFEERFYTCRSMERPSEYYTYMIEEINIEEDTDKVIEESEVITD